MRMEILLNVLKNSKTKAKSSSALYLFSNYTMQQFSLSQTPNYIKYKFYYLN